MSEKRCPRYEQLSLLYQAFWLAMCWVVPSLLYVLLAQCNGACGACDWSFESGLALDRPGWTRLLAPPRRPNPALWHWLQHASAGSTLAGAEITPVPADTA